MYNKLKELNQKLNTTASINEDIILKFEDELSIKFGIEFKTYLKEFGCLRIKYIEFYGICGDNKSIPSAIYATISMRENINGFPQDLIVFYEDGDGSFNCIDSSDNVYICNYNNCQKTNQTLSEFIYNKVKEL